MAMRGAPNESEPARLSLVPIEPGQNRAGLGCGLRRTRCKAAMGCPRHFYQRRGHTAKLKRLVVLFRIAYRGTVILAAHNHQCRRSYVANQRKWRVLPVSFGIFPWEL